MGFKKLHGDKPFDIGSVVKLVRDLDNRHDKEAIAVWMRYLGKVAYVANSVRSVVK